MQNIIEIKSVTKKFGSHLVLDNINIAFLEGVISCVVGPSGAGKSTLMKLINNLVSEDYGQVLYRGVSINTVNIAENIGTVFQNFNLFENKTALENITYAYIKHKKCSKQEAIHKATELTEKFNIDKSILDKYPKYLSGGQKQRISICRALILNPKVILFDEPTAALDEANIAVLSNILLNLKAMGTTIIIITHNLQFTKQIADRVAFLDNGSIIEYREKQDFFSSPKFKLTQEFIKGL